MNFPFRTDSVLNPFTCLGACVDNLGLLIGRASRHSSAVSSQQKNALIAPASDLGLREVE